jgi:hypothetical protein
MGLSLDDTPLFDPNLSAKQVGLGKSSNSEQVIDNLSTNPASIHLSEGLSISGTQYQSINYSAISFVNKLGDHYLGLKYLGSSISTIERSYIEDDTEIYAIDTYVPYEFHSLTGAYANKFWVFTLGASLNYSTIVLDDFNTSNLYYSVGLNILPIKQFGISATISNIPISLSNNSALLKNNQITYYSAHYKLSRFTTAYISSIENKNEIDSQSTLHVGLEQYISKIIAVRMGLDHNRYTFGTGIYLNPFQIDIGWAQSKDAIIDDQIMVSFSYNFNPKNKLYRD